jgi:hypothetical protein
LARGSCSASAASHSCTTVLDLGTVVTRPRRCCVARRRDIELTARLDPPWRR